MREFCERLNERDRRHFAAIEADRLGRGGIEYISRVLKIDRKTIWAGMAELKKTTFQELESGEKGEGENL